eukprot:scaffold868_cov249-Pinguiococcus_pyrenoidosus.AAC.11
MKFAIQPAFARPISVLRVRSDTLTEADTAVTRMRCGVASARGGIFVSTYGRFRQAALYTGLLALGIVTPCPFPCYVIDVPGKVHTSGDL